MAMPELLNPLLFFLEEGNVRISGGLYHLNTEIFKITQNNSSYPFKYSFREAQHS